MHMRVCFCNIERVQGEFTDRRICLCACVCMCVSVCVCASVCTSEWICQVISLV